jgi:hypothetical protein
VRVRRVLAIEWGHVAAVPVQPLAAGQAPWPAHRLTARAADPEPGRVLPAVDAQLDRVRQQAPLRAARPTETASSLSVLRPCPREYTRTRAASLAGTSSTISPSVTSRWASDRPARGSLPPPSAAGTTGRRTRSVAHSHPWCWRTGPSRSASWSPGPALRRYCWPYAGPPRSSQHRSRKVPPGHRGFLLARRAMQLRAAQTSNEPQPHRVSRAGRRAVREPEHPEATAADSRASPPCPAPEDPRSPGSQPRSKTSCRFGMAGSGTGLTG